MPGTTPVYGFPYPEPTDLVADYPALGQQLAEDIEDVLPTIGGLVPATPTSIANSGGTATLSGNTVTATGVSSVSLNGVFTANFVTYKIVIAGSGSTDGSGAVATRARLRSAGSDNSVNYRESHVFNTQAAGPSRAYATGATSMLFGWIFNGNGGQIIADVSNTFTTEKSTGLTYSESFGASGAVFGVGGVSHDSASSFDGFTIFPASGTLTVTISVYGYRK